MAKKKKKKKASWLSDDLMGALGVCWLCGM